MDSQHIADISRVIQLAVAPVFLLTAVGTLITAMNNRLSRVIDRRRLLLERKRKGDDVGGTDAELRVLSRRVKLIYFAILFAVMAALSVCIVVAGAFVGALFAVDLARAVAIFFIVAMIALICCLSLFMREVFLAVTGGKPLKLLPFQN
jgi:hypothetical protein